MREYNHKPNSAFSNLPLDTLVGLFIPAVHELIKALDKKDQLLITQNKKEVELLYCSIEKKHKMTSAVKTETLAQPEIRDIEKQIKGKNKELQVLGKELKSKRKKRSGAVIADDITQLNEDVSTLNEQISPVTTETV